MIAAASAIALVPLFLGAWGVEGYGRWLLLVAALSYLSLLELGGQSLFGNLLAYAYVRRDADSFRRRLAEAVSVFSIVAGLAFVGLLVTVAVWGQLAPTVRLTPEEQTIITFLGAAYLLAIPSGVYVTAYRATKLFTRGTMMGNLVSGMALIAYVAVLLARLSPAVLAITTLAAGTIGTLVLVADIRRRIPAARGLALGIAAAGAGARHLGSSLHFSLLSIAAAVNQQAVILVLAASAGPAVVALYATHRTAAGFVGYVARILEAPLRPELTFLHAAGREHDLRRAALLSVKVVTLLSGTLAAVVWFFLPWVYPLWTGRHLNLVSALMGVLLLQAALAAGWSTAGWPLLASNRHHRLAYCAALNAGLTVVLAVILAPRFGAVGVAVASLVGDVVFGAFVYPWLAARSLGHALATGYQALLRPLVWSATAAITLTILGALFTAWLFALGAALAVAGCAYGAIRTTFEDDERAVLMTKLRQLAVQGIAGCWSVARS
ncbi:MAG: lipopolysaccharide biosynthesis protein [Acidobacteriia bacterium]|nr:lipopolysaccharide biosynthesis protein [Terriglobia bacterium]